MTPEQFLKHAEKQADHVIVKEGTNQELLIQVTNNAIDAAEQSEAKGFTIKLWKDNKHAVVSVSTLSKVVLSKAIATAKANSPDEYFYGLPDKETPEPAQSPQKKILQLSPDTLVETAQQLIQQTEGVTLSQAKIATNHHISRTLTSNGVDTTNELATYSVVASVSARNANNASSVWDEKTERAYFETDMGTKLKQKAQDFLNAKHLSEKAIIILKPEPLAELLEHTMMDSFNLKNIEKDRSVLKGKLSTQAFDQKLTITDDPTLKNGTSTYRVDFDGSKAHKKTLVENGILTNFLSDFNTAQHNKLPNTANGGERGISASNVVVEGPYQELKNAIIVEAVLGAHTCDAITTSFSVKVDSAYFKKNGVKTPIKDFMISGKMIDVLNHITSISKKQDKVGNLHCGALASEKIHVVL